jgi:hypothetical protein
MLRPYPVQLSGDPEVRAPGGYLETEIRLTTRATPGA